MDTNQIYNIVNSVTAQALGSQAITVVDERGLISLGDTILNSSTNTEAFLNTLVQRIGRTIISYRRYRSMFSDLLRSDTEWGGIIQKIKVSMPQAEEDQSFDLEDGGTVDHFKINKPKVSQKLFVSRTPYQMHITIQREHLKEAFLSVQALDSFIGAIYGEVQNAIEMQIENMGRNALNNYIAEVSDSATRRIHLLTEYQQETGAQSPLTPQEALLDEAFLRFAISRIKEVSTLMTSMSTIFNDGSESRHTPYELQRLYIMNRFEKRLETQVQYAAFKDQYVKLNGFLEVPFLQSIQTPNEVQVIRASDKDSGATTTVSNIVAMIFDYEALGTYKNDEWTSTTPFNSAGGYANTYWHFKKLWFNDLSENFILFTLD